MITQTEVRLHEMTPRVSISLFGPMAVRHNGRSIALDDRRRARNLLALLALDHPRSVPGERIMDVLWPELTVARARNCMHVTISRLRRALRTAGTPDVIDLRHESYGLADSSVWIDLVAFEESLRAARRADQAGDAVTAAIQYERGVAIGSAPLLDDEPYADWVIERRDAARLDLLAAYGRLIDMHAEAGRHLACVFTAREALRIDSCNEHVSGRLIAGLVALGHVSLAVAEYFRLERVLAAELGVAPRPDIADLLGDRIGLTER